MTTHDIHNPLVTLRLLSTLLQKTLNVGIEDELSEGIEDRDPLLHLRTARNDREDKESLQQRNRGQRNECGHNEVHEPGTSLLKRKADTNRK